MKCASFPTHCADSSKATLPPRDPNIALSLVNLDPLTAITRGCPEVAVGLIDGPVLRDHPDLAKARIRELPGPSHGTCSRPESTACAHGTFVAGMLCAASGICPDCSLFVRAIFSEEIGPDGEMPSAAPAELAQAIVDSVRAGARVLNISAALAQPTGKSDRELQDALDYASRRGVIVIVAGGNQGSLCGTAITSHPWVIPVAACDLRGRPIRLSNLGSSIGRRGLVAPGEEIAGLGVTGESVKLSGTSVAAPFVSGTVALLWSLHPSAPAASIRRAVAGPSPFQRRSVVPPLLDAWAAYQAMRGQ